MSQKNKPFKKVDLNKRRKITRKKRIDIIKVDSDSSEDECTSPIKIDSDTSEDDYVTPVKLTSNELKTPIKQNQQENFYSQSQEVEWDNMYLNTENLILQEENENLHSKVDKLEEKIKEYLKTVADLEVLLAKEYLK